MFVRLLTRAVLGIVVALTVLVTLAIGGAWWFGFDRLSTTVTRLAVDRGIPLSTFSIASVSSSMVELSDLAFGDEAVTAERVRITFDLNQALEERRVETVMVDGLRIRGRIVDGSISLAGITVPSSAEGQDTAPLTVPSLPLDRIEVTDVTVQVDGPMGEVVASAALEGVVGTDGALSVFVSELKAAHATGSLTAKGEATIGRDLTVDGRLFELAGTVVRSLARLGFVDGEINALWRPNFAPSWAVTLPTLLVEGEGQPLVSASLMAEGAPLPSQISMRVDMPAWGLRGAADIALTSASNLDADAVISATITVGEIEALLHALGLDLPVAGAVEARLDMTQPILGLWDAEGEWFERLKGAEARVDVRGRNLQWSDHMTVSEVQAPFAVRVDDQAIRLQADRPWVADGLQGTTPFGLVLGDHGDTAMRLRIPLRLLDQPVELEVAGRGYWGDSVAAGAVGALLGWTDGQPTLQLGRFSFASGPLAYEDLLGAVTEATVIAHGDLNTFDAHARLAMVGDGGIGPIRVRDGRFSADVAVNWADDALSVFPLDPCQDVEAASLSIADTIVFDRPIQACLAAGSGEAEPLVSWSGKNGATGLSATLNPLTTPVTVAGIAAEVALPAIPLAVSRLSDSAGWDLQARLRGARLGLTDFDVGADQLDLDIVASLPEGGGSSVIGATLQDGRVTSAATPALFAPVRVIGTGRVAGDRLAVQATATGALGALSLQADLSHRVSTGEGAMDLTLAPLSFAPNVRQPADVIPALSTESVEQVSGVVEATGQFAWRSGAPLSSGGSVRISDGAAVTTAGTVLGIETDLTLTSLLPLVIPPGQAIRFDEADVGVVLGPGSSTFDLSADQVLTVSDVSIAWADGTLATEPFALDLTAVAPDLVLTAQDISLPDVLARLPVEGLTTTGRLQGRVPVRVEGPTLIVDNAVLESVAPGTIRYQPPQPPAFAAGDQGGGVDLFLQAVENLHYETLRLTLNGRTGDDLAVGIAIEGANPDLYDGYPVALNVTVTGALDEILRDSLRAANYGILAGDRLQARARNAVTDDAIDQILRIGQ